uniref:Uncharacterized protein n=1 Tax=Candidatus Kentrum sp. FM TaxID=2126340 RepID=A0A450S5K5_9GAMM|nr:MAG: hypothetical protein BECKFM1743A_GA0114220_1004414 [Candidatus Kentron sp. FM]VFJ47650.1 MAG: hypothetical protein BECKFM1743C_GA0114222_1004813 [Candidatus Kentron sp. FM]VFK07662.1 MAG: hypothetical protein BECKFM1743B_GA0114221_1004713 [Candidatus Kentron sp. FM]
MSEKRFSSISKVLGYKSRLADALISYSQRDESTKEDFKGMWREWMTNCPHARHLCYADITFFPEGALTKKDALSLVITPALDSEDEDKNGTVYKTALRNYIESGYTMAPHKVFELGLPYVGENFPQTSGELKKFWEENPSSEIESGLLVEKLHIYKEPTDKSKNISFSVGEMPTYENDDTFSPEEISARPISEHFSKWCEVFDREAKEGRLRSAADGSPYWTVVCPIGSRDSKKPSDYTLITCLFLGFDAALKESQWHESLRYIMLHLYEANATARASRTGKKETEGVFAHQTSAIIDSIMDSVRRLPGDIREGMGATLLARLSLLHATIHAYRTKPARRDPGLFPYPWRKDKNPLAVYRDIGIQLGLARCEDAPQDEPEVRKMGKLAREPGFQIGEPGFEEFRQLFEDIPSVSPDVCEHIQHSNFAVLILLVLKQAVYHTVRAQEKQRSTEARISLKVENREDGVRFSCMVINPSVTEINKEFDAKDKKELRALAERLSQIDEHEIVYLVDGPRPDRKANCWKTRICIQEKQGS